MTVTVFRTIIPSTITFLFRIGEKILVGTVVIVRLHNGPGRDANNIILIDIKFGTKVNGHFSSKNHLTNVEKMNSYKKTKETGSVITQISSFHKEEVAKNRKYMSYLIEVVLYLAKQEAINKSSYLCVFGMQSVLNLMKGFYSLLMFPVDKTPIVLLLLFINVLKI
ncbi:hypothetical protein QTP88_006665 [Uroleucon formosanum]